MMTSSAELEALYRLFNNPRVTIEALLSPHYDATKLRIERAPTDVLVAHDTTQFCFPGEAERENLGPVTNSGRGFFGHFALAFADDAVRTPLGIAGLRTVFRSADKPAQKRESARWLELLDDVSARTDKQRVIHLMDREADWAQLFEKLTTHAHRFVIRLCQNRKLNHSEKRLFETFEGATDLLERDVQLSARSDRGRRIDAKNSHPARGARNTRVGLCARRVVLDAAKAPIALNVVRVRELDPPQGQKPILWWLATSEPIETAQDLARIVDLYRARWLIEEFFKSPQVRLPLPAATAPERPRPAQRLGNLGPSRLANARPALARSPPETRSGKHRPHRAPDPGPARLHRNRRFARHRRPGGHLKHNGPPGWSTLAHGMAELLLIEIGWVARDLQM